MAGPLPEASLAMPAERMSGLRPGVRLTLAWKGDAVGRS
jgi:hypothetical protein